MTLNTKNWQLVMASKEVLRVILPLLRYLTEEDKARVRQQLEREGKA